jgi:Translation initiation factor IF-2, N-terminal region
MEHDFMKRGYLLPEGCKDLIDILKLKPHQEPKHPSLQHHVSPPPLPPVIGELVIPESASVLHLARLLSQKPFQIVADLMQLGVFATVKQTLDFEVISSVARKYGFIAKRAA